MERRKVLFTAGLSNDKAIIITDAPYEKIEKWCCRYNIAMEDGTYGKEVEPFDTLKTQYYVRELHDSEIHDNADVELIGYDVWVDYFYYIRDDLLKLAARLIALADDFDHYEFADTFDHDNIEDAILHTENMMESGGAKVKSLIDFCDDIMETQDDEEDALYQEALAIKTRLENLFRGGVNDEQEDF